MFVLERMEAERPGERSGMAVPWSGDAARLKGSPVSGAVSIPLWLLCSGLLFGRDDLVTLTHTDLQERCW